VRWLAARERPLGRGVRVLLEEVVLYSTVVVAEAVGQLDLVERLMEQPVLAVLVPRPGQLVLVEDPEPHAGYRTVDHGCRADLRSSGDSDPPRNSRRLPVTPPPRTGCHTPTAPKETNGVTYD